MSQNRHTSTTLNSWRIILFDYRRRITLNNKIWFTMQKFYEICNHFTDVTNLSLGVFNHFTELISASFKMSSELLLHIIISYWIILFSQWQSNLAGLWQTVECAARIQYPCSFNKAAICLLAIAIHYQQSSTNISSANWIFFTTITVYKSIQSATKYNIHGAIWNIRNYYNQQSNHFSMLKLYACNFIQVIQIINIWNKW